MNNSSHVSRSAAVYLHVKEKIIYREFTPGQLLFEGDIAAILNVSKTPVREAFNRLQHEGLIEVIPYKGYFVSTLTFENIKELFELRILLEGFSAKAAAERCSDEQLIELTRLARTKIDSQSPNAQKEFLKANVEFHTLIGKLSGNRVISLQIESAINRLQRVLFQDTTQATISRMEAEHCELAEAIQSRKGVEAQAISNQHLLDALMRIMNYSI